MAVNKYPSPCTACGATVPANGGTLIRRGRRWSVTHIACSDGTPRVIATTFGVTGDTIYQNARGRCEDAPCCGCCSY